MPLSAPPLPQLGEILAGYASTRYAFVSGAILASAGLGNNNLRVMPMYSPVPVPIDRFGANVTVVGEAGSVFRLGIYADDGSYYPGALLLDAGTIAGDSATVQEKTTFLWLPAGIVWVGGAVQGAPTTVPTMQTVAGVNHATQTSSNATSSGTTIGFAAAGVSGALPNPFPPGVGGGSGSNARVFLRSVS